MSKLSLSIHACLSAADLHAAGQALNVYIALLDRRQLAEHGGGLPGAGSASPASRAAAVVLEDQAVAGLAPHAAKLAELLSVIDCTRTQVWSRHHHSCSADLVSCLGGAYHVTAGRCSHKLQLEAELNRLLLS